MPRAILGTSYPHNQPVSGHCCYLGSTDESLVGGYSRSVVHTFDVHSLKPGRLLLVHNQLQLNKDASASMDSQPRWSQLLQVIILSTRGTRLKYCRKRKLFLSFLSALQVKSHFLSGVGTIWTYNNFESLYSIGLISAQLQQEERASGLILWVGYWLFCFVLFLPMVFI